MLVLILDGLDGVVPADQRIQRDLGVDLRLSYTRAAAGAQRT
ncbi:hypothetical protein VTA80_15395 [Pengzhenrongella phosphoraccumulans]